MSRPAPPARAADVTDSGCGHGRGAANTQSCERKRARLPAPMIRLLHHCCLGGKYNRVPAVHAPRRVRVFAFHGHAYQVGSFIRKGNEVELRGAACRRMRRPHVRHRGDVLACTCACRPVAQCGRLCRTLVCAPSCVVLAKRVVAVKRLAAILESWGRGRGVPGWVRWQHNPRVSTRALSEASQNEAGCGEKTGQPSCHV